MQSIKHKEDKTKRMWEKNIKNEGAELTEREQIAFGFVKHYINFMNGQETQIRNMDNTREK